MYSITTVIYGIPLTEKLYDFVSSLNIEEELSELGFTEKYSGSSDFPPAYLGVELSNFDETVSPLDISTLTLKPTKIHKQEFNIKFAAMHIKAKQLFSAKDYNTFTSLLPEVGTYFIFSTS